MKLVNNKGKIVPKSGKANFMFLIKSKQIFWTILASIFNIEKFTLVI